MTSAQKFALQAAKEIVVARVANSSVAMNAENGKLVGDYFEQVYKKLCKIATEEDFKTRVT